MQKRKIILIIEHCEIKGIYPFERAVTLANLLQDEEVFLFVKTANEQLLDKLDDTGLNIVNFEQFYRAYKRKFVNSNLI